MSNTTVQQKVGWGAAIASIMFSVALGGFVSNVARAVNIPLTLQERNEVILLLEDNAFPKEAAAAIARQVPNLEQLISNPIE